MQSIAEQLARFGTIGFDEFMELALYEPDEGFFTMSGGAGRGGADFITSPEVGPLFGAVVARYLDARWDELGRPDPFVVVEAAAGRGALAISVLAAAPECAPALRYVLVERSAALRERQREHLPLVEPFTVLGPDADPDSWDDAPTGRGTGPLVCSLDELPVGPVVGVVLANELLDNVPFRLAEYDAAADRWMEVRVGAAAPDGASGDGPAGGGDRTVPGAASDGAEGELAEVLVPLDEAAEVLLRRVATNCSHGARVPLQARAGRWLRSALETLERGSVVVVDYTDSTSSLAQRPVGEWLRTYRAHQRGGAPLESPGSQDITCEVAADQLELIREPTRQMPQAAWLRRHGLDELVEEGRQLWEASAHAPDLAAMRARSRVVEADALADPAGMGSFTVLEWDIERR